MIKTIKKYLSGCLKHIVLTGVLGLSVHFSYADDITNTNNYLPNGKYRLFGSGRGEVQNINNNIRLHGQLTQQAGNLQIETKNYQGNLSYEQHFHNHGHRVHAPFSNTAQKNFSAKKGSVVQGGATLTDLSVTGYEIHPADAYDGEQGGGYPVPTGARDEYLYEVNGKEVSVKVVSLDKLPSKANDNQLLRQAGIDPERYNLPQTTDEHNKIERLTFDSASTNHNGSGIYYGGGDLIHNGQGWENAQIRQPEMLSNPSSNENKRIFLDVFSTQLPTVVIPSSSTRTTDEYGNIITLRKPTSTGDYYNLSINSDKFVDAVSVAPKIIVTPSPYGYFKSSPFGGPLLNNTGSLSSGGGSGSQSNGNNDSQNDYDNPPVLGYYDDDGDDLLYYQTTDNYYGNSFVGYDDDYDPYLLDIDAINALNANDEDNSYPINSPYGLAYYVHQNEQNSESSWWDTGKYLTPIYGDWLSFKEAESGWDYALAVVGIVPSPWTKGAKGANVANKARKAVNKAGEAAGAAGKAANVNTVINADKFNYIFGQVTSNSHNAARSAQLSQTMKTLGIPNNAYGRNLLTEHFSKVTQESNNIVKTFSNNYGNFEIRESLFAGPSGKFVKFETTYQVLPNGTRVFNTVIPKGGQ